MVANEKELRKLNRAELLQLLLFQTKEAEHLQEELEQAKRELAERRLQIRNAGDLAHAVLEINQVAVAAQAAAQQYLDNIAAMERETDRRCKQMLKETKMQCDLMVAEARQEASAIRNEADVILRKEQKSQRFRIPVADSEERKLLSELHALLDE